MGEVTHFLSVLNLLQLHLYVILLVYLSRKIIFEISGLNNKQMF